MVEVRKVLNKRMLLMLAGCLLLFGGIFGFKLFGNYMMNQYFDSMPLPPATVSAAPAEQQRWRESLSAVGSLRAVNGVEVTTQTQGVVSAIHFHSGQRIEQGTLLVELAAGPEKAEIKAREADLVYARQQHERITSLFARGVTTASEVDDARSTLERARAGLEVQRAIVARHSIYAPFSGLLGIREVDLGENVNPGQAVVSLQQLDPIFVDFALPERDFARVAQGLEVSLSTSAYPGRKFRGRISAVAAAVDIGSRNFEIQATLENPEQLLRPGMYADVAVELTGERQLLVVPRTAISFAPYGNSVFVLQKGGEDGGLVAIRRFVKTGEERGDLVEITEGLSAGEQVATSGLLKLRNEGSVIINNQNPPPAQADPHPENN